MTDPSSAPRGGTVAFLGAGAMAEALLAGLRREDAEVDVVVSVRRSERGAELTERYGVRVLENPQAAGQADVVVVCVKPKDVAGLLDEIGPALAEGAVVVSVAAGLTTAFCEQHLPAGTAVVRVMPNTPALVGAGVCAVSAGSCVTAEQVERAEALLRPAGLVLRVPEDQQDAVTAVSGSGPAYLFYVADAMIEAGVLLGLTRSVATELTVATLLGGSRMLAETGEHPVLLRERVSSPAGTTIEALRTFDERGVRAAFVAAMQACRDRARQLSAS